MVAREASRARYAAQVPFARVMPALTSPTAGLAHAMPTSAGASAARVMPSPPSHLAPFGLRRRTWPACLRAAPGQRLVDADCGDGIAVCANPGDITPDTGILRTVNRLPRAVLDRVSPAAMPPRASMRRTPPFSPARPFFRARPQTVCRRPALENPAAYQHAPAVTVACTRGRWGIECASPFGARPAPSRPRRCERDRVLGSC